MYTSTDDTIVAISSAPGGALRGIVRMSGPAAIAIADSLVTLEAGGTLEEAGGFTVHVGTVRVTPTHDAPADVYLFRGPRSYTRQDLVELHTLGAPPLLDLIIERCLTAGARLAHPGEFTARSFLGGALTLLEAESVAATIHARSDAQLRAARRMRDTHLADEIAGWQDRLAHLRALVEADIDFADEPIDFISTAELSAQVAVLVARLAELLSAARAAERMEVLPRVLLIGLPNAGKSTLMNRLAGIDRAIASAVAGTTRDLLSAPARFGDIEALLLDSAGWAAHDDEIVRDATARSAEAAHTADVVCVVVDAADPPPPAAWAKLLELVDGAALVVANKCDLVAPADRTRNSLALTGVERGQVVWVSALTGQGLDELADAVASRLSAGSGVGDDVALALSARQRAALRSAAEALMRCASTAQSTPDLLDIAELVAIDLRDAQEALAELTGAVTTEDLLGRIFASFCIGK